VRNHFVVAALAGLVKNGEPSDVSYARKFLPKKAGEYYGDIQVQAIKLLERFGDKGDADSVLQVAKSSFGDLKILAVKVALQLSPGIDGAAKQLLQETEGESFRLAVESLASAPGGEVKQVLTPYLEAEDNSKRLHALRFFVRNCRPDELNNLLAVYMGQGRYYYNVVCWLDRILFAPAPVKEAYLRDLEKE
jgi:hypothetical protein